MICPLCNQETRVVDSENRGDQVWRRRRCPEGHVFHTHEIVTLAPDAERPKPGAALNHPITFQPKGANSRTRIRAKGARKPGRPKGTKSDRVVRAVPTVKVLSEKTWEPPRDPAPWARAILERL